MRQHDRRQREGRVGKECAGRLYDCLMRICTFRAFWDYTQRRTGIHENWTFTDGGYTYGNVRIDSFDRTCIMSFMEGDIHGRMFPRRLLVGGQSHISLSFEPCRMHCDAW